jgi:pimeloyl-ACP methyl ester carboxylesterase
MDEKFVTVNGNKIRYLASGKSDDYIVLIHGLGASAERWEFVIPEFSKHHTVIKKPILLVPP